MLVGLLPAIVDNSPFIFAELTMDLQMSNGQPLPQQPTLGRFGNQSSSDGYGTRSLHLQCSPKMQLGHRLEVRRQHHGTPALE
jgi:hypothetical protein